MMVKYGERRAEVFGVNKILFIVPKNSIHNCKICISASIILIDDTHINEKHSWWTFWWSRRLNWVWKITASSNWSILAVIEVAQNILRLYQPSRNVAIYLDIWLSQSRQFHFAACGRSDSAIISSCSFFPVFIIHHLAVLTLPLQSDRKREMGEYTPRERRRTELESSADLSSQTLTMEKARRWGNGGVDASDQFWLIISCSACSVITHSVVVLSFHFFLVLFFW